VISDVEWLQKRHDWPERKVDHPITGVTRATSPAKAAARFAIFTALSLLIGGQSRDTDA
jgi:hypothetical protein